MTNILALISQIQKLGLDKNPKVMALLRSLIINPHNKERWEQLNHMLKPAMIYDALFGKPFARPNQAVRGDIKFAFTEQGLPIGVNLIEPHILIAGQTGSGKSVLLMLILAEAIIQGV
jgi:type IV secretory pathway VirB4 component